MYVCMYFACVSVTNGDISKWDVSRVLCMSMVGE